jgi:hypothetical protein
LERLHICTRSLVSNSAASGSSFGGALLLHHQHRAAPQLNQGKTAGNTVPLLSLLTAWQDVLNQILHHEASAVMAVRCDVWRLLDSRAPTRLRCGPCTEHCLSCSVRASGLCSKGRPLHHPQVDLLAGVPRGLPAKKVPSTSSITGRWAICHPNRRSLIRHSLTDHSSALMQNCICMRWALSSDMMMRYSNIDIQIWSMIGAYICLRRHLPALTGR